MSAAPPNPPAPAEPTEPPRSPLPAVGADEFYVGYLPAPPNSARFARRAAEALAALTLVVALTVAAAQREPGPGAFPAAASERLSGVVFHSPCPLYLFSNDDGSRRWLLFVSEGKFGPDERIASTPPGVGSIAKGRVVGAPGATSPGCIELAPGADALRADTALDSAALTAGRAPERPLGRLILRGQIIDPKCHFGAMKPGEGKVHRGCAARCIAGGIPPVLLVREATPSGERLRYYILLGREGEPVNDHVLDFIAEPVEATGEASSLLAPDGTEVGGDALRVLRFDPSTIKRLR